MLSTTQYWDSFYSKTFSVQIPSQFGVFCAGEELGKVGQIIELGCGNGRDSLFFGSTGFSVYASDAVSGLKSDVGEPSEIKFRRVDYSSRTALGAYLDGIPNVADSVAYLRFLLHAVDEQVEDNLLNGLALLKRRGLLRAYLEFRTTDDENLTKATPPHYRRFVNLEVFLRKLQEYDFLVDYKIEGRGYAKYGEDDAFVARLVIS